MHPRPIYRWKTFWLGLLILIFLSWSWTRPAGTDAVVTWFPFGQKGIVAYSRSSQSQIAYFKVRPPALKPGLDAWIDRLRPPGEDPAPTPPPLVYINDRVAIGITFAHWFLILLFIFPWLAFLTWRSRRMKHAS